MVESINSRNVFSFKVAGQIYHKINLAAHPSQATEGDFEPPSYGQMYFLDLDEAVEEHLANHLNYWIVPSLIDLLEEILRDTKNYAKCYMKIREVDDDVSQIADLLGQQPRLEDKRQ